MRMGELSRLSGVPIPTIKYYVREGLLRAGERTNYNQAHYDDLHLRRLRLVRALLEVGGLSIAAAREVLALIDAQSDDFHRLGKAHYALTPRKEPGAGEEWEQAAGEVKDLLARKGWEVSPRNPALNHLIEALATLRRLGQDDRSGLLDAYADAAQTLAGADLDMLQGRTGLESMAEATVVWTAIGETVLTSLRKLAHEAEGARRFGRAVFTDER
ncbi:MerR family transcriptional regulator [Nonomuraea typhae]|uniref:MerR family transcriptional regulator n=1 Tax=Nonomuraea typhae TaxID=2603600 RepID=A0ABW7YLJ2_9ACTN